MWQGPAFRPRLDFLFCAAVFAFLWLAARACVQSVTIDEADTYLVYVAPPAPTQWSGSANNQLLNSLLMRLFICVFGLSHLSLRAPALLGAAIYIHAARRVVRRISHEVLVQLPIFLCLVYNPFIMDHLVAARGYSLALAFLMAAFAFHDQCALASVCAGLSFTANFSFAFVDAATLLLVLVGAWKSGRRPVRAAFACVMPGLAVVLFLAGSVLATWPKGQFIYGATSWAETFRGIVAASLYEPNPFFVNPPLRRFLEKGSIFLVPLLGATCIWRMATAARSRDARREWIAGLAAITLLTLIAHWLLFRVGQVLLPKERTAIYLVPLVMLMAGVLAAIPGGLSRLALVSVLSLMATYFILCLRLTYFKEWRFDADARETYFVLSYYNHKRGLTDIVLNWRYTSVLNFYRTQSGHETIPELATTLPPYPAGHQAYVMFYPDDWTFIRDHGLKIVYHGARSDAVVAVDPEVEEETAASRRAAPQSITRRTMSP